jgi:hypothetical protein
MSGERRRSARKTTALLVGALLLTSAVPAAGQGGDKAMAESLFQAGRALMKEGKPAQACPKFAESQRIDPSAGTLLNLGKCLEAQGKTASAWSAYKEAVAMARVSGQTKHVTAGTEFIAAVEPRLSRLRIDAPSPTPGLEVKRDGMVIGEGGLGVAIVADPGDHVVEASAPGHVAWRATVTVGAVADSKTIEVPALEKSTGDAPPPAPTVAPTAEPAPTVTDISSLPPGARPPTGSTLRTVGFVSLGVGVAGIVVGGIFGVMTLGDADDAEGDPALCPNKRCSDEGLAAIDSAETKALVSTLGFAVGGGAAAAGVVMILASRRNAPATTTARMLPMVGPRGAGMGVTGRF